MLAKLRLLLQNIHYACLIKYLISSGLEIQRRHLTLQQACRLLGTFLTYTTVDGFLSPFVIMVTIGD